MNVIKKYLLLCLAGGSVMAQGRSPQAAPPAVDVPPPVSTLPTAPAIPALPALPAVPAPPSKEVYIYDQKPLPNQPVLVSSEQAKAVMEKFKTAYAGLGKPRMALYVNRELVDE